jgi:DNA-binding beta-propeller fold protein YncE
VAACTVVAVAVAASPAGAAKPHGALVQPDGRKGCVVDQAALHQGCTLVRSLLGPAPFTGSNAVAVSGRNVYVASADSNTVTVLRRAGQRLVQLPGRSGCIGGGPFSGCVPARALDKPTSVAVSPNGRHVYVAAMGSSSVGVMARSPHTGALRQTGCISARPRPGCTTGRALRGVDVVAASPDGANVYAGSFKDGAVVSFAQRRDGLAQTGCVSDRTRGCSPGTALGGVEGLAVSPDGRNVYAAAAISGAVAVLDRSTGGTLTQSPPPAGCLSESTVDGCRSARVTGGADAVAVAPDGENVYVAAGLEDGLAIFSRDTGTGALRQLPGTAGCMVNAAAIACSLGRAFVDPEGVAVSPDNKNVYVGAFGSGAVDVFNRKRQQSGRLIQKRKRLGCIMQRRTPGCARGRALAAANGIALSPSGGRVYVGAFRADAVAVFRRAGVGGGGGCHCGKD